MSPLTKRLWTISFFQSKISTAIKILWHRNDGFLLSRVVFFLILSKHHLIALDFFSVHKLNQCFHCFGFFSDFTQYKPLGIFGFHLYPVSLLRDHRWFLKCRLTQDSNRFLVPAMPFSSASWWKLSLVKLSRKKNLLEKHVTFKGIKLWYLYT